MKSRLIKIFAMVVLVCFGGYAYGAAQPENAHYSDQINVIPTVELQPPDPPVAGPKPFSVPLVITEFLTSVSAVDEGDIPIEGAECTIESNDGIWHVMTPGSAKVVTKSSDYMVLTCKKDGYCTSTIKLPTKIKKVLPANVAGFPGFLGGDSIPVSYPVSITAKMKKVSDSQANQTGDTSSLEAL